MVSPNCRDLVLEWKEPVETPAEEVRLRPFLEREARSRRQTVDQYLADFARQVLACPPPRRERDRLIAWGSVLRMDSAEKRQVARALRRAGLRDGRVLRAALAALVLRRSSPGAA
jgi:hypothetical protein